ncbi:2-oxoacid:ferredoxin oxidoreductase subunit beta [Qaidamihabitans albus]|uniref:2-oxoacid:ferredoxin oxidoreductase subunit beta n=1 Tax=Qaidamihabitans albus TaxID=2795733 RepID=UPI0018F22D80|nr:2-oxoacid:ferredoxin oxidoreductase subunit beta [Qaidamihabitans albus]
MTATDLGLPTLGGLDLVPTSDEPQKSKEYKSDQEVRWCPGCGDYIVLNTIQSFLPTLGLRRENIVFVSGIGCSSRFPYYMNTYGMHSIHGRAPAIATGLATTRPDLSVWVVTGDGDALSIGGNHLIHSLRRNVNLKILLFNNRIYGLTKGQYSPTSDQGMVTKSTPMGSVDTPFNPISLALGAEASFVGRALDSDKKGLTEVLGAAAAHRGSALVEIYQNCPIFNDGAFDVLKDKDEAERRLIPLKAGEPIRFGPDGDYGVTRSAWGGLEAGKVSEIGEDNLVVHDPTIEDTAYAFALSRLGGQDLQQTPTGIFRQVSRPTYDDQARAQVQQAAEAKTPDLHALLRGKDTWTVT